MTDEPQPCESRDGLYPCDSQLVNWSPLFGWRCVNHMVTLTERHLRQPVTALTYTATDPLEGTHP